MTHLRRILELAWVILGLGLIVAIFARSYLGNAGGDVFIVIMVVAGVCAVTADFGILILSRIARRRANSGQVKQD